jgi:hypothetical protein
VLDLKRAHSLDGSLSAMSLRFTPKGPQGGHTHATRSYILGPTSSAVLTIPSPVGLGLTSRPRAACSACYLLVWRALQVSFSYLFESCRCATRSDVTNAIARAEIDFLYISAGCRGVTPTRWSAEYPCPPPALYPLPRTLPIPHMQGPSFEPGVSG